MRAIISGTTILRFAPHVKFRHDETRGRWIILAPEKLMLPDEPAVETLKLVDGARTIDVVVDQLAQQFNASRDVIAADVLSMLQDLVDKGVLSAVQ